MVNRKSPRLTHQSLKVLHAFMEKPQEELSGADIRRRTKLFSGTLYPILLRFEDAGLVTSSWEEGDPRQLGRPRKRFYKISGEGVKAANEAFGSLGVANGGWVST